MPLDPWLAARLDSIRHLPAMDDVEGEWEVVEEWEEDPAPWTMPAAVRTQDGTVDGPHGPVPVRIYRSEDIRRGVFVWSHGGGFSIGDLHMPEAHMVSAELSARTGFDVVSVDYRLADGDVRFPVPVDDVHAVLRWARREYGPEAAFAFGGASAGTTLSLSAALRLRDEGERVDGILLAYPFAHFPVPAPTADFAREMDELPISQRLGHSVMSVIVENYVGRTSDLPALAVPGDQPLHGLAPTYVMVSEYDDLRPSGELLVQQLEQAGVPTSFFIAEGMLHGHLNRLPSLAEVDRSLEFFADALREIGARVARTSSGVSEAAAG